MQALSKSMDLKHTCVFCDQEFNVDVEYNDAANDTRRFMAKTRQGKYSDSVVFMTEDSYDVAVRCPKCNVYNKIKIKL